VIKLVNKKNELKYQYLFRKWHYFFVIITCRGHFKIYNYWTDLFS